MCIKSQTEQNILLKLSFPIIILMCGLIFLSYKDYQRQQHRLNIIEKILKNTELLIEHKKHQEHD